MLITDKGTEGQMELAEAPWGISALSIHVTEGAAGTLPPPLIICSQGRHLCGSWVPQH